MHNFWAVSNAGASQVERALFDETWRWWAVRFSSAVSRAPAEFGCADAPGERRNGPVSNWQKRNDGLADYVTLAAPLCSVALSRGVDADRGVSVSE
jgi:hypothetical protein